MSDSDFDPSDMAEMDRKFHQIIRDSDRGYCVELHLTVLAARDMVKEWIQHLMGDEEATSNCLSNYAYIMTKIMETLQQDDDNDAV